MTARTLMLQGTASSVGKSLLVAALCRIFRQDGLRVAPFKSQNMALNSFVTREGGEMGRAQVVQALAAGQEPSVDMNPVLLKPEADHRSQVVVAGRVRGSMGFREYRALREELLGLIGQSLARLRASNDVVVIEGAGSPAEINLRAGEIVNMRIASLADAPVLLVGDIDRGGVFAHLVGTLELLEPDERARVKGFLINKFRGDVSLLKPGLEFLEQRTGVPVLGVIPYLRDLGIADEDSVALEGRLGTPAAAGSEGATTGVDMPVAVDVAIIALPHIANFDDFDALEREPAVSVRYVDSPVALGTPDLIVLPGTKTTLADLRWMQERGLELAVRAHAARGGAVVGICGGYQMLGRRIDDPEGAESAAGDGADGLDLLPVRTVFDRRKATHQVTARVADARGLLAECADAPLTAYEIHMGRTDTLDEGAAPAFGAVTRTDLRGAAPGTDGVLGRDGHTLGTYFHGLFDNAALRRSVLRYVAGRSGKLAAMAEYEWGAAGSTDQAFDRLAAAVREAVDLARVYSIAGLGRPRPVASAADAVG